MGTLLRTSRNTSRQITTSRSSQPTRRTPYTTTSPTLSHTYLTDACRHAHQGHWRRLALPARAHLLWHLVCTSPYSCTSRLRQVAVHLLRQQVLWQSEVYRLTSTSTMPASPCNKSEISDYNFHCEGSDLNKSEIAELLIHSIRNSGYHYWVDRTHDFGR